MRGILVNDVGQVFHQTKGWNYLEATVEYRERWPYIYSAVTFGEKVARCRYVFAALPIYIEELT